MRKRNMLAVLILIGGAAASFYCYARLSQLLPMGDKDMVTPTVATVTAITTPMVKKGGSVSDVTNDVRFAFHAAGKTYQGGYNVKGRDKAPEMGAIVHVVYYTSRPNIFLRQEEYDDLPRQLKALRLMMITFALIAIVAPFGVMKHG
jgi:hypothetical protein